MVTNTRPPVEMVGDTLVFNADAFKLDANAQTEDLLRVLPGVTIWADGTITVNGREVKSVLVNGKKFFSGDARIATQNIPKDIVDKVQVYQKVQDPHNVSDSTAEINIRLKKGKGFGYFGKLDGGLGTTGHYEGNGSLNFFNGQTQLGLAVASNNVNKVADNIDFILRNNTFKGITASTENQSNFDIQGINKFLGGGLIFQHSFLRNPDYNNNKQIAAQYFVKNNQQDLIQNTQTVTTLADGSFFRLQSASRNENTQESQNANAAYERLKDGNKFSMEGNFTNRTTNASIQNISNTFDQNSSLLNNNSIFNRMLNRINGFDFKTAYSQNPSSSKRSWLSGYELNYKLNVLSSKENNNYRSIYVPAVNATKKIILDRLYDNGSTALSNSFGFKLPDFGSAIFGEYKLGGIMVGLQNDLQLTTNNISSNVGDMDSTAGKYINNTYLTNRRSEVIFNTKPALTLTRRVYRNLSDRYQKKVEVAANFGVQFYDLNSISEKLFQQFSKSFQRFTPSAMFSYQNLQTGEYIEDLNVSVNFTTQYPSVQQLAPLIDSSNLNFIQKGNSQLKAQDTREMTFRFTHASISNRNILSWSATLSAGYINNYIAGSSVIDSLGATVYAPTNANGYRYLNGTGVFKKAFKWLDHKIQFSISPTASISRTPGYTNATLRYYNNFSTSYNPGINYTYKNWLAVDISARQIYSHYNQEGSNDSRLSSVISQSAISLSVNCNAHFTVGSNATYTNNTYNGVDVKRFTIWNATVNYRFLKGNVAEIKLSALDLLHQNTGLTNFGYNNSITQGVVNTLQQYFMVGFAYYPRKFGK